ncbi:30S ribosomal protein S6 [symbiont of Argiope bruennichi]|uniref:30S ribosomal protein S6 n=1 Tax=symbiont of Argiope bruennichi TaxID=2810479 RepID=UPI003DA4785B
MTFYELIYILSPNLSDKEIEENNQKIGSIVEVLHLEDWGIRELAYKINKFTTGHYVILKIKTNHDKLQELKNYFVVNKNVIRYLIINLSKEKNYQIPEKFENFKPFDFDKAKKPRKIEKERKKPSE